MVEFALVSGPGGYFVSVLVHTNDRFDNSSNALKSLFDWMKASKVPRWDDYEGSVIRAGSTQVDDRDDRSGG